MSTSLKLNLTIILSLICSIATIFKFYMTDFKQIMVLAENSVLFLYPNLVSRAFWKLTNIKFNPFSNLKKDLFSAGLRPAET